jgi:hypothetical protein
MSQHTIFIKGEKFNKEEHKHIEFKREVSSSSNDSLVKGIVGYAEQYIIGFLNALIEGSLYIGIDNSGTIEGIQLSERDRDQVLQSIPNKLINAKPTVPVSSYDVDIIDVFDSEDNVIENLNIVHIYVLQPDEEEFFLQSGKNRCVDLQYR